VVLVLGGRDKDSDWSELIPLVRDRVKHVLLVGEAAGDLARILDGLAPITRSVTLDRAVTDGFEAASSGDVVLLSPGCASFDQFRSFADRGETFRRQVRALAARLDEDSDG
jgi:UDP-N-acetylmuramoylalanine--D-glutamate ligase